MSKISASGNALVSHYRLAASNPREFIRCEMTGAKAGAKAVVPEYAAAKALTTMAVDSAAAGYAAREAGAKAIAKAVGKKALGTFTVAGLLWDLGTYSVAGVKARNQCEAAYAATVAAQPKPSPKPEIRGVNGATTISGEPMRESGHISRQS